VELFVSLFDFLVKCLVLDLQLLEIDQVKAIGKLLSLFQDLFLVGKPVSKGDVLKSILMNLLILHRLSLVPLFKDFLVDLLSSSRHDGVLSNTLLQLLELLLNLMAFGLFFIEFSLQLRSHLVVSILSLF
jgi:hypothetical protein